MEISFSSISLIDILGLIQGLILGLLLIFISKKEKSTFFLGMFIIAYSLDFIPRIIEGTNISLPKKLLDLFLLIDFSWILFPLFYIYVQKISITKRKISYWVLLPGIIVFLFNVVIFFLNSKTQSVIHNSILFQVLQLASIFYCCYIGFLILKWIKKHTIELRNQYSSTEFKELRWAKNFVILGILFILIYSISMFFEVKKEFYLIMSIIDVVLLYWISLRGILQQNVKQLMPLTENLDHTEIEEVHHKSSAIKNTDDEMNTFIKKLDDFVTEENIFLKQDLTIIDISKKLNVHPKYISTAINTQLNLNFNSYINQYRVSKAKEFLKSSKSNNFSIEGIGNEVGFQSKSAFYDAFKKNTGMTPLNFKKSNS